MSQNTEATTEVRRTIERLIEDGSNYNVEELEKLYHRRLKVFVIDENGDVSVFDKARNMELFRAKRADGAEPLSRWAKFDHVEGAKGTGFVIWTRKMELRGRPEKFILAIHLAQEDVRWQVTHETVFVQPLEQD
jgi:hypothetical protein